MKPAVLHICKAVITVQPFGGSNIKRQTWRSAGVLLWRSCVVWCVCCGVRAASDASQMGASWHRPCLALECIRPSLSPSSVPGEAGLAEVITPQLYHSRVVDVKTDTDSFWDLLSRKVGDLWTNANGRQKKPKQLLRKCLKQITFKYQKGINM